MKHKHIYKLEIPTGSPYQKSDMIFADGGYGIIIKTHDNSTIKTITVYTKPLKSKFDCFILDFKIFFWNLFKII